MFFTLPRPFARRGIRPRAAVPGSYITDGRRLFRVTSRIDADHDCPLVALEDCATLEVKAYVLDELGAMQLRLVGTAHAAQHASDESAEICDTPERASVLAEKGVRTHAEIQ